MPDIVSDVPVVVTIREGVERPVLEELLSRWLSDNVGQSVSPFQSYLDDTPDY